MIQSLRHSPSRLSWLSMLILGAGVSCKSRHASMNAEGSSLMSVETGRELHIKRKSSSGLREASGLAVFQQGIQSTVYVIGDRDLTIGRANYQGADRDLDFQLTEVADFYRQAGRETPDASQWEAVTVDGVGNIVLLRENPAELHIFDSRLSRLAALVQLTVRPEDNVYEEWNEDGNSKGEGIVLLRKGHLLLLKEKKPSMLIEFGPDGAQPLGYSNQTRIQPGEAFPTNNRELFPLKVWRVGDSIESRSSDLAELAVDGSGILYALGDQEKMIFQISGKSPEEMRDGTLLPEGRTFRANIKWKLPAPIEKPEGLTFVDGDRPIVSLDDCGRSDNCVFTMNRLYDRSE